MDAFIKFVFVLLGTLYGVDVETRVAALIVFSMAVVVAEGVFHPMAERPDNVLLVYSGCVYALCRWTGSHSPRYVRGTI